MVAVLSWQVRSLRDSVVAIVQCKDPKDVLSYGRDALGAYLQTRDIPLIHVLNLSRPRQTLLDLADFWFLDQVVIVHPEVWSWPRRGKS